MNKYITFNDTSIKVKKNIVIKKFLLKKIDYSETKKVSQLIYNYYKELENTGISLPKLISYKDLTFKFTYCGDSLIQILKKTNLDDKFLDDVIVQISKILQKCSSCKVSMDPHIKNFTIKNGIIYYVDTFPPVSKEYIQILTNYNKINKKHIVAHLNTWKPDKLRYHFLADIKKTSNLNPNLYEKSKKYFIDKGFIRNFSNKKVNSIIKIENNNLFRESFTLS